MKSKTNKPGSRWERKLLALAVASCFAAEVSYALPTSPTVVHGQVTIGTNGKTLTVTNSNGAIINWQSFGIASQEIVRFLQQSGHSAVLNRVTGSTPSSILGQMQSNGRVFLINPNGITIGKGAVIDVAGFAASSLNLSDKDFLAGRMRFGETPGAGAVVNRGEIKTSSGGMVYLVGQNVENHGVIRSPQGEIILAAGKSIELVDAATPEIRVQITASDNEALNLGELLASGGRIGMYAGLVRHGGTANANTAVVGENGKIIFKAIRDVKLEAGSVTSASGPNAGSIKVEAQTGTAVVAGTVEANATAGPGGSIDVSGQQGVTIEPTARVAANGLQGGTVALSSSAGQVQVSGRVTAAGSDGRGGQVAIAAATQAVIADGARIDASGTTRGGSVSVKAVENVKVESGGAIEANGSAGGTVTVAAEQGSVEVSGTIEATGSAYTGGTINLAALSDITLGDASVLKVSGRRGGETWIEAREGTTLASGLIDAYGHDGPGGKVLLLGPRVALVRNATVNASGMSGGGIVLVGGDFHGGNPQIRNADRTFVGSRVLITADAIETGNGGRVSLWANDSVAFHGFIGVRGGAQSGDGGFVEISSKHVLFSGTVNGLAPRGKVGSLLVDPLTLTITENDLETLGITTTFEADNLITFADFVGDDEALVPGGISVTFRTLNAGSNITFADFADTIRTQGTGTITFESAGQINLANLATANQAIQVTAADSITLGSGGTGGALNAGVAGVSLTTTAGSILRDGVGTVTGGDVVLDSVTGVGTAGSRILTAATNLAARAASGDVYVAQSGSVTLQDIGAVANSASGAYDVTVSAGNLKVGAGGVNTGTSGSTTLTTTTSGDILIDAGVGNTNAATTLTAAGSILNDTVGGAVSGTDVALSAGTGIGTQLSPIVTAADSLSATTTGATAPIYINETDGLTALTVKVQHSDGNVTWNAAADSLVFDSGTGALAVSAASAGTDVSFETTAGNISVSAVDVGSNAATLKASGTISQTGAIVAGLLTTSSDGGTVLDNTGNTVTSLDATNTTGGVIEFTNSQDLAVAGIDNGTRAVTLTVDGAISQTGAIVAGLLTTSSDGGTVLDNTGNTVTSLDATNTGSGNIELTNSAAPLTVTNINQTGGGDVVIDNTGAIVVDGTVTVTGGDLALTSSGSITDAAGASISVTGNASFTGTSISLADNATDVLSVSGTASFDGGAGNVTVAAAGTVNFGSLTFNTTGGAVSITEDSGTQLTGTNTADSLTLVSGGALTDAAGTSVTVDNGDASFTGASISLADNATDVLSVSGTASFDGGAGNVTVAAAGTVNFGSLTFNTTAGAVSITEDSATQLTGTNTADSLTLVSGGALTDAAGTSVTVDNGDASFTGASISLADNATDVLSVSGTASFDGGAGNVTVAAAGTVNFGSLNFNTTGGAVSITEDSGTQLTGTNTADSLTIVSGGALTDAAGTSVTVDNGNASFTGTSISLADNATDVLSVSGTASFDGGAGNVTVAAAGTVNFGSLTFNTTGGAVSITEDSSTQLTGTNTADSLTLVSGGALTDAAGTSVTVDNGDASFTGASISLADNATDVLSVSGTASFDGGAGNVTVAAAGTVNFGSLTFNTTGGAVSITEDSGTQLTGTNTADSLTIVSGGALTDAAGTSVTVDNGDASFTGTSISLADNATDVLSVSGTASFDGGAGNVTVAAAGTVNFGSLTFNTTGGAVSITEDSSTQLTGTSTADSLTLVSAGAITDAAGTSVTVDNGNASFTGTSISLADNATDVLSVSGTASFDGGAGNVTVAAAGTVNFGSLTFNTTGGAVSITEDSGTQLTGTNTADSLTIVSGGALTDAAGTSVTVDNGDASFTGTSISLADNATDVLSVSGTASFDGGAGNVTVAAAGTVNFGSLTFNTTGGAVSITEDSGTQLTGTNTADSVALTSGGALTDAAGMSLTVTNDVSFTGTSINLADNGTDVLSVSGTASFDGGAGNVTVAAAGTVNFGSLTFNTTGGAVSITEDSSTQLTGTSTADSLTLTSAGAITDAAATSLTVATNASLSGTSITLGDNGGDTTNFGSLTFNSAGAVNITEDSATQLTGTNTANSLALTSAGAITDAAATSLTVTGNADLAGTSITLGDNGGDTTNFGSLTFNSAGAVNITEDSATQLTGTNTANSLALTSAGAITDAAATSLTVTGNADLSGTSITLGDNGGDTTNFGSLTFNSAGAVNITEDSATQLTGTNTANSLVLTSAGAITDAVATSLTVNGNADLAGTSITLGDNGGDTTNFGSLTFNSAGAVNITEDSATQLTGTNTADSLTLVSAAALIDAAGTSVTVTSDASFTGTSINLADNGADVLSVGGTASFDAGAGAITVAAAGAVNFGSLTFNTTGGAVSITEDSGTQLTGANTADSLTLASAGAIADAAGTSLTVTNNADLSGTSITLGDNGGDVINFGSLTFISAGAVTITEDSGTQLTGTNTAGSLTLTSGGALTDAAGTSVTVTNDASFTGTSISLADNGTDVLNIGGTASFDGGSGNVTVAGAGTVNFGSLTFNTTDGAVSITEDSGTQLAGTSTADSLTLVSAGAITDAAATSVTIDNGNASFTGTSISLADNAADVLSVSGTASFDGGAGNVTVAGAGTVNFGSLTFNTTGGVVSITEDSGTQLTGTSTADSLILVSAGAITDAAATSVTIDNGNASFTGTSISLADNAADVLSVSGTASFDGGSGSVTVAGAGAVNFGSLTFNTTGGVVSITEDSGTQLTGTNTADSLTLVSAAALIDAAGTSVTVTSDASFTGTSINLADNGADVLSVGGTASFDAGAGAITVAAAGAVNFGSLTFNTTGGAVSITEDSGTQLTGTSTADSLTLVSAGALTDAAATSVTIDNGNASFTGTSISLADNAADVLSVSGTASFDAGAGAITVAAAGAVNFGSLNFNTTGGAVSITEDSGTQLTGTNTASSLTLTSAGAITDASATSLTVSNNAALSGTSITLGDNGGDTTNFGSLTFNSVGAVSITEDSATQLTSTNTANSLTLTSAGAITDAAATSLTVSGNADLAGTSIALGDNGGDTTNFGSLTFNSAGAVNITEDSATQLTGTNTANSLTLTSAGAITDAAATSLTVSGNADLAGTSIALGDNGGDTTNFGSLTFNSAGAVNITEDSATQLTGTNTANSLTLTSAGAITDAAATSLTVSGNADLAGTSITLGDNGGDTTNFGSLTFNSAGAVNITEDSATQLTGTNTANSLTLTSAGAITDAAATSLTVGGNADLAGTSITLGDNGGDTTNFGSLTFNSAGAVNITEDSATQLTGTNTANSLTLTSAGAITDAAATSLTVSGNADLAGTSIALGDNGGDTTNFGSLTFNSAGAVNITEDSATLLAGANTAEAFTLTSAGSINDGAGAAQLLIDGTTDLVAGAGSVTLINNNNNFVGAVSIISPQNATLRDTNALILGDVTVNGSGLNGVLTLNADGVVTQLGGTAISARHLELLGPGSYTLTSTGNDVVTIAANGPSSVNYRDSNNLTVGTAGSTVGMNVGGNLQLVTLNGGTLTINDSITTTADGNITLNNAGSLIVNALINADGNVIQNGAGTITLNSDINTSNDLVEFAQHVLLTGDRSIDTSANPGTGAGGTIRFLSTVNGGGNSLTMVTPGTSGNVELNGAATNLSALTISNAQNVSLQSVTTTSGAIDITAQGTATFAGAVNSGGALRIDAQNVNLQGVTTSGAIDITAQGTATLGGAMIGGGDVTLLVNDLALTGSGAINAGSNDVRIRPATTTRQITLGGTAAGTLQISDVELDRIDTNGLLTIGAGNHTGRITIAGDISPLDADGGFTIINRDNGIVVNADIVYNGPGSAGRLTLTADGGNNVNSTTGAITDGNAGSPFTIQAGELRLNAATGIGTSSSPIDISGGTVAADNSTSGGIFLRAPNGNLTVAGTGVNNNGGQIELTANATGAGAGSTIIVNGPITSSGGRIVVRAADDIVIDRPITSNGGDIYIIAGSAPGMNHPGMPVDAATEPADTFGGVTIKDPIQAQGGDIIIYATESVVQAPQPAPNTGGGIAGLVNTADLIVRTYNDTPGAGFIDLRHNTGSTGNSNGRITLETRLRNDNSAPGEPNNYAASNIDYRSGTTIVITGIGTSADFVAIADEQNIDLNALNIQAKNLTLIARDGNVNVNAQITNSQINNGNTGGSLNLLASNDVNVNQVAGTRGITIGRVDPNAHPVRGFDPDTGLPKPESIEKFDHDLKLVAQNDINIRGSIHLKGDLQLRADASRGEVRRVGGAVGFGNGFGSVIIDASGTVDPGRTADPVIVSAEDIVVGAKDAADKPLPVQNLIITAGTATGPGRQSASASLQAANKLEIFLTGDMTLTGGTVSAANEAPANSIVENSAAATIAGFSVLIRGWKNSDNTNIPSPDVQYDTNNSDINLTGRTATATQTPGNSGAAKADASALILSGSTANIDVGGDITIRGGDAFADGAKATARAIAGTEIGTQITGNQLLTVKAANLYINGGTANAQNGAIAEGLGILASSGAIQISTTGTDGVVLNGGAGSGFFDALGPSLVAVPGTGYPIDISGNKDDISNPGAQTATIVAGAPLVDESLLAAFLRATEAARDDALGQDPNLPVKGGKGQAGVCK